MNSYSSFKIDSEFEDYLINNITKAKDFVSKHPEMSFNLSISLPDDEDENKFIDITLWYKPNPNISQDLKNQLTNKIKSWYYSLPPSYKETIIDPSCEEEPWERNCYGSQPLQVTFREFRNFNILWKALNRDKKIDEILNG